MFPEPQDFSPFQLWENDKFPDLEIIEVEEEPTPSWEKYIIVFILGVLFASIYYICFTVFWNNYII